MNPVAKFSAEIVGEQIQRWAGLIKDGERLKAENLGDYALRPSGLSPVSRSQAEPAAAIARRFS